MSDDKQRYSIYRPNVTECRVSFRDVTSTRSAAAVFAGTSDTDDVTVTSPMTSVMVGLIGVMICTCTIDNKSHKMVLYTLY